MNRFANACPKKGEGLFDNDDAPLYDRAEDEELIQELSQRYTDGEE